jgi:hypothetical protein
LKIPKRIPGVRFRSASETQLATRTSSRTLPWLTLLIVAIFLLALARGLLMLTANPLVALANNYDQIRYTACLDLYPWRPGQDPTANNPQAPLELYNIQHLVGPGCYWTSDLAFQGTTVAIYRLEEKLSRDTVHSVRLLGTVRLLAWIIGAGWLCSAFWREGKLGLALANAVWLAALGFDPVNSIYLNSYYAEAGTLFFAYLTVGVTVLTAVRRTPSRIAMLLLAAALLGLGKMQHLALPLFLAILVVGWWWLPTWRHQYQHLAAILRAPLLAGEKMRLASSVCRGYITHRNILARELADAASRATRGWGRRTVPPT